MDRHFHVFLNIIARSYFWMCGTVFFYATKWKCQHLKNSIFIILLISSLLKSPAQRKRKLQLPNEVLLHDQRIEQSFSTPVYVYVDIILLIINILLLEYNVLLLECVVDLKMVHIFPNIGVIVQSFYFASIFMLCHIMRCCCLQQLAVKTDKWCPLISVLTCVHKLGSRTTISLSGVI